MKKFNEVKTNIDNLSSFYTKYRGNSVGRMLHYIYCICGLRYAEKVTFQGDGIITYFGVFFATVSHNKGYPYFNFMDDYFNVKQDSLLK